MPLYLSQIAALQREKAVLECTARKFMHRYLADQHYYVDEPDTDHHDIAAEPDTDHHEKK